MQREFEFDHLLLTLGSETDFFDMAGVRDWAVTMKNLSDAALLCNRMVALLEEGTLETDESPRRKALTFVTAGGGFAGVETTGAVNDFVRETAQYYPSIPRGIHSSRCRSSRQLFATRIGRRTRPVRRTQTARAEGSGYQGRESCQLRLFNCHVDGWHFDSRSESHLDSGYKSQQGCFVVAL